MSVIPLLMERLAWANKHINDANEIAIASVNENSHKLVLKQESKRRLVVTVESVEPYPRELSLHIGDAAHNLRSVLDNLAFAISNPPAGKENKVYFPICKNPADWIASGPRKLLGANPDAIAAIERLQPYHSGPQMPMAEYLGLLNTLNNWDKHKELAICRAATGGVSFIRERTIPSRGIVCSSIQCGIFEPGAVLATFDVDEDVESGDIKMQPEVHLAPIFDERMPEELRKLVILEVLRKSFWFIERTVIPTLRRFL